MTNDEFKTAISKYQDLIECLGDGLVFYDRMGPESESRCDVNCHIWLYSQDMYGSTYAEWNDNGEVHIYIYEGENNSYNDEYSCLDVKSLENWIENNFVQMNKYELHDELEEKYVK